MKVRDYISLLSNLESKRTEFENLINGSVGVHTMAILQREIEDVVLDIMALENLALETKPQVVGIRLLGDAPVIKVGNTAPIDLNYTLSNGELKKFGLEPNATVVYVDLDLVSKTDNEGFITSFDASTFNGAYDMSLKITRTANGFDVFDDNETQGLQVVEQNGKFEIVDTFGQSLGLSFTEAGTVAGDDFRVLIIRNTSVLTITSLNEEVVAVDGLNLIGKKIGKTKVVVEAENLNFTFDVEVNNVDVPPTPPTTEEVLQSVLDNTTFTATKTMTVEADAVVVNATYTDALELLNETSKEDVEKFLVALHAEGTDSIEYFYVDYAWDDTVSGTGSKFKRADGTLLIDALGTDTKQYLVDASVLTADEILALEGGTLTLDSAKATAVNDFFKANAFIIAIDGKLVKLYKSV